MNELQRKEMVLEQLCQVMMGGHHNEKWANTFFEEHKEWLLNLDLQTKDQMDAFYDLKNLVSDPDFIREMKKSMGNFWSMVKDNNIPATEWERDMKTLTQKAIKAHAEGVEADSEELQALVDEWMGIIAKNINKPINKQFVKIFKQRVDEMSGRQSQRYWEIVCRISPEKIAESKANQLLARGLDYKLENYEGE
jgi:hypothetical protein